MLLLAISVFICGHPDGPKIFKQLVAGPVVSADTALLIVNSCACFKPLCVSVVDTDYVATDVVIVGERTILERD